jgi:hypothetical protein
MRVLNAADAVGWLERKLAKQPEYSVAELAPNEEPGSVRDKRGSHGKEPCEEKAELMFGR